MFLPRSSVPPELNSVLISSPYFPNGTGEMATQLVETVLIRFRKYPGESPGKQIGVTTLFPTLTKHNPLLSPTAYIST